LNYDWNVIKWIGFFGDINTLNGLKDYAHARGVKLVQGTSMGNADMTNATLRSNWIQSQIGSAQANGYDGVSLDYEGNDPTQITGFNALAVETANAFHAQMPGSLVSINGPIYPQFEARNYDYANIAKAADFILIMAYDGQFSNNLQCGVPGSPVACYNANAAYPEVEYGIQQFIGLGIDPLKLIVVLPWYGLAYQYVLSKGIFDGQVKYRDILALRSAHPSGTVSYNTASRTQIFKCGGVCSSANGATEVWYDDASTLTDKYALSYQYGLLGVGMWLSTNVDGTADEPAMWGALCTRP